MAYKFAKQSEVKELESWCMDILHAVQEEVRDYFTFDIRLIGSGDKRLVTQNSDESFDLDYNIILQRDKKGLLNNPKQIKDIFVSRFNKILKECVSDYTHTCDSTSVITVKLIRNNKLHFSFDVAIVVEGDDGLFYRLINDKSTGNPVIGTYDLKVTKHEMVCPAYNYESFVKSFKRNFEKHINSLQKYTGDKTNGIFLIELVGANITVMQNGRFLKFYRLAIDQELLTYINQYTEYLKFIIFASADSYEILELNEIPKLLYNLPHGLTFGVGRFINEKLSLFIDI